MPSRSFAGVQLQSVPPAHFVLLALGPCEAALCDASALLHEFFIQAADAADGGKTGRTAAEPAVQEEIQGRVNRETDNSLNS